MTELAFFGATLALVAGVVACAYLWYRVQLRRTEVSDQALVEKFCAAAEAAGERGRALEARFAALEARKDPDVERLAKDVASLRSAITLKSTSGRG